VDGRKEHFVNTSDRKFGFLIAVLAMLTLAGPPHTATAQDTCCFNNFRFAGGCMVVPSGSETCQSILSYLNSFDSVGRYYCGNTTVRGGWSLAPCAGAANNQPQTYSPQTAQPSQGIQQRQPSVRPSQPQTAPGAQDASLMQISAPLQVRFDESVDSSNRGAGQALTGTLLADLMSGDTVIAPAGSKVQAQLVPTSFWDNGAGDAFRIQATGIEVGDHVVPVNATAVEAPGELATSGTRVSIPEGTPVSFETTAADADAGRTGALTSGSTRWMGTFNDKDADDLASLYAEDAVMLPPNAPAVFGRDAIRSSFREMFAAQDLKVEVEALETVVEGDLAYVAGRYRMWTGDGTLVDRGKYVEIWRAVNGEWLIHRDIHNSSLPIAETDDLEE
jgi:uncharacterized protein (TIGR02246 family)